MRNYLIEGKKFGNLTLIKELPMVPGRNHKWLCRCDCGNFCDVYDFNLLRGNTKSCGCLLYRYITYQNKTLNMTEWAREVGISYWALAKRISRGWPIEKALTQPPRRRSGSDGHD